MSLLLLFSGGEAPSSPFYSINAGTQLHGVFADWERVVLRANPDGTMTYSPYAINTWQMPLMLMADFEELRAQQGASLTSLETNNIDSRNEAKTYTTAILESVVNGGQRGVAATGVTVRFRVKVS